MRLDPKFLHLRVSPLTSVSTDFGRIRIAELISLAVHSRDLGSGGDSDFLGTLLRSRIVLTGSEGSPQIVPSKCSTLPPTAGKNGQKSIMDLLAMGGNKSGRSMLKSEDLSSFVHEAVKYLSAEFNGNRVFELSPLTVVKEGGLSRLDGMDRKRDGHVWTETTTTNISDPSGILSFKYKKCLRHLRCDNIDCCCLRENGTVNELYWSGSSPDVIAPGQSPLLSKKFKIVCKFCRLAPFCLATC